MCQVEDTESSSRKPGLLSDLHFTEIPPAAVGGSAAVVLTFMSVWATLQGPCIVRPTLHTVSMRTGSCDNIWTKHEGGIWRGGKTESREGNGTNNGFFKHLFYSRSKCMPSFNPVDGILLCLSPLALQTALQEAWIWRKNRGCSGPPFFSLLSFGATRLPGALKSIFRAVVSGRRKDLPFKHRASSVGRRIPLTLCLEPFLSLNASTESFLGSETHTMDFTYK